MQIGRASLKGPTQLQVESSCPVLSPKERKTVCWLAQCFVLAFLLCAVAPHLFFWQLLHKKAKRQQPFVLTCCTRWHHRTRGGRERAWCADTDVVAAGASIATDAAAGLVSTADANGAQNLQGEYK